MIKDDLPNVDRLRQKLDALGLVEPEDKLLVGLFDRPPLRRGLLCRAAFPGTQVLLRQPLERQVNIDEFGRRARLLRQDWRHNPSQVPLLLYQRLAHLAPSLLLKLPDHLSQVRRVVEDHVL